MAEELNNQGQTGNEQRDAKSSLFANLRHQLRNSIAATVEWSSKQGKLVRIMLLLVAAIAAALLLLWIVDKFVLYYLARSYVDEVANVLDLNPHLANAIILLTFVTAVFFVRFLWSFSRRRRLVGIAGIAALFVAHSLVLWYGTRDKSFDRAGNAIKCYVLTRDGQVTYGEHAGVDPATGRQCRLVTPEMLERLQKYAAGKRPQAITNPSPVFFDPRSGEPIVWYYADKTNGVEIFDLMGFHPDTGEELLPITKEVAEQWKKQSDKRSRRVPRLIVDPDKYVFFDPLNGQARAWYWVGSNGRYEFYDSERVSAADR